MELENDSTWVPGLLFSTRVNSRHNISVDFKPSKYIISKYFAPWTGMGTPENPYQINNVTKLRLLADNVDAGIEYEDTYFVITADLDLSDYKNRNGGIGWNPIGKYYSPFSGHIDGSGKKIKNLYIRRLKESYIGLFGYTDSGCTIKDLCLENVSVRGDCYVGGLVGYYRGEITSCYTTGSVTGGLGVGGLLGHLSGKVFSCYSKSRVIGNSFFGPFIGDNKGEVVDSKHIYSEE